METELPDVEAFSTADDYRAALERAQVELLAVVNRHAQWRGSQFVAYALIELTGSVCAAHVEARPQSAFDLDARLGALRLYVAATNGRPQ